jgi:SAM-dependent methyltransferase
MLSGVMKAKGWSIPQTNDKVLELLGPLDWKRSRVADVGAGRGAFSMLLGEKLRAEHGLGPREHLFACDPISKSFEYDGIDCAPTLANGRLPFEDASFDATVSIEVIEHVEDSFAFLRELARVTKPGGRVIVTTPNVLNLSSRLRSFACGFPELFDPLPIRDGDPRVCSGHIHPIAPYFLAFAALRAGLIDPTLHSDRTKHSAAALTVLCSPVLFVGNALQRARLARKQPRVLEANSDLLAAVRSWRMLTGRTAILCASKPTSPP